MSEALPIPVLTGDLVTLRQHDASHAQGVFERAVDPVTQQFTTVPRDYTLEMAHEYVTEFTAPSPDQVCWAIEVDDRYAGSIDLRVMDVDAGAGSLGFATHQELRGRGLMTDAVRVVVRYAFEELGWQSCRWQAHVDNWGSAKAVWRVGFPVPTFVPDLLVERGRLIDGWISTLHAPAPAEPVATWDEVVAALTR